ncbi:MAG: hypothetical protein ACK5V3_00025 [Bdellovibrionales bacterium]
MKWISVLVFLQSLNAFAKNCGLRSPQVESTIQKFTESISTLSTQSFECAEQEFIDVFFDEIWLQNFVMKQCEAKPECKASLLAEASRVSRLDQSRFEKLNAIALWGEIQKYSAFNRMATLQFSDLPLDEDPLALYEKLKSEKIAGRALKKNENVALACTALAAVIGPAKFKAIRAAGKVLNSAAKIQRARDVEKLINNNKLPQLVKEKFLKWEKEVNEKGIGEVRKIPGYHDEPVGTGGRSVRLNDHFRACYEILVENGISIIKVFSISADHKNYCR